MGRFTGLGALIVVAALAGCSSKSARPSLLEIVNRVEPGMTPDEVRTIAGTPTTVLSDRNELWVYETRKPSPGSPPWVSTVEFVNVVFSGGKVERVSGPMGADGHAPPVIKKREPTTSPNTGG